MRVLLVLLALLLGLPGAGRAQEFEALAAQLGGGFAQQAEAAERLGQLGDPRAIPLLRALGDAQLRRDGAAVRVGGEGEVIRINNRVRGAIRVALGRLQLVSPDPAERLAAADGLLRARSAEDIPALEAALAREALPRVRERMELALGAARLASPAAEVQRLGIAVLGASASPQARALLLGAQPAEAALQAEVAAAVAAIDRRLALRRAAETVFQGLSLGSVLLLAALGLAVTFGVMGVINMAHGEFVMLGAYATVVVQELCRGSPALEPWALPLAVPAAFAVTAALGALMERGLIRHLYGRPLETLLLTFGAGMVLQQAVRLGFGAQNREVTSPPWMQGTLALPFGLEVTQNRAWIIVFALLVLGATFAAIRLTRFGLEMRAVVQNRRTAAAMGIRTGRVDALTFAFGSGIAGLAGVALSQIDNVSPNLGTGYIIDSFMVVVFGGVGSLLGTLIGAFTLGLVNKLLEPWAGAVLAKVLVLVAIMLFIQRRPKGLFALRGRAADQ
ncbi:urea ABC transporter permease subunit UrtB [Roseococcus sp. DSY-14]|uniref:urea ABC transporter permease subunit UrtB n=1 Tax=Roseococcus sp. DSY-14 TaxID=3369650 RepID=UPI00387B5EE8